MSDLSAHYELDAPPESTDVTAYRDEASDNDSDIVVRYVSPDGETRHLVVSPRGTCVVLLDDVSRDAFAPQKEAVTIADALQA